MKMKSYPSQSDRKQKNEPGVGEEGAKYGRGILRKSEPTIGVSVAAARKRLRKPMKRSAKEFRWALGIAGIGDGPKDLSANMRAYLRREK